jgi:hypothetical protein
LRAWLKDFQNGVAEFSDDSQDRKPELYNISKFRLSFSGFKARDQNSL